MLRTANPIARSAHRDEPPDPDQGRWRCRHTRSGPAVRSGPPSARSWAGRMPRRVSTSSRANASPTSANAAAVFGRHPVRLTEPQRLPLQGLAKRSWSGPRPSRRGSPPRVPGRSAARRPRRRCRWRGGGRSSPPTPAPTATRRPVGRPGPTPGFMAVRPGIRLLRTATSNVHPASTRTPLRIAAAPARACDGRGAGEITADLW